MSFLMSFVVENRLLSWTLLFFRESGFAFTRLDGSMAQKRRAEAIQCFQSSGAGSPTVMLLSLKAGGVGLNLTAASRVFLMDPVSNGLLIVVWLALGVLLSTSSAGECPFWGRQGCSSFISLCVCFNTVFRAVRLFTVSEKNVGSTVKKLVWHLTVPYFSICSFISFSFCLIILNVVFCLFCLITSKALKWDFRDRIFFRCYNAVLHCSGLLFLWIYK